MTGNDESQAQMIHCDECGVVEGKGNRGNFDECPHGNDYCEDGSACVDCCIMADIARRY